MASVEEKTCGAAKNNQRFHVRAEISAGKILCSIGAPGQVKKGHKLPIICEPASGDHEITFQIVGSPGFRFMRDDPIITADNVDCNHLKGSPASNQIRIVSCTDDQLVIHNENSDDARLIRYGFRIVDRNDIEHVCDPVILNGGGGID